MEIVTNLSPDSFTAVPNFNYLSQAVYELYSGLKS